MKAYVIATGAIFGLITLAHIARMFAEGSRLAAEADRLLRKAREIRTELECCEPKQ